MKKAFRIVLRTLLGLVLVVVVVVLGAIVALQWKPVRGFVRDKVLAAVRGSLKGELYVDDVRMPSLERIELSGVTLTDRRGVTVVALSSAVIDLRLQPLLAAQIAVDHLDLDHVYVDLADLGDEAGLLSVFASDPPKPGAKPKPPPDPNAGLSPIRIGVRELCIAEGAVELQPQAARALSLHHIHSCLKLDVGRSLEVALPALRAELSQNNQRALLLAEPKELPALPVLGASAAPGVNAPMRGALSGKFRFRTADDMAFDVRVAARGASAHTLDALAIDSSSLLPTARVDVDVHAATHGKRIAYRIELRAPDSAAHASGELDAQRVLWTRLSSERFEPARLTHVELPRLAFRLDSKLDLSAKDVLDEQLELVSGQYGAWALPKVSIAARRAQDGTLTLRSLEARYASALLTGSGKLAADGGLQAEVKVSAPDLAALPPLAAAVNGLNGALSTQVQLRRSASGVIVASAAVQLRSLALQGNRAEQVSLSVRANGTLQRPVLHAALTGRELFVSGEHVGQVDLQLDGGPDRYLIAGRADVARLALSGWLQAQAPGWAGGLSLTTDIGKGPIAIDLPRARFEPGRNLEIQQLRAQFLDVSLFADGQIGLGKRESRLRFGLVAPDLTTLTRKFDAKDVPGRVELAGNLRGSIEQPALEARLKYLHGFPLLGHESEANLHSVVDLARATAHVEFTAKAGAAHARAELDSKWRRKQPLVAAIRAGEHTLRLDFGGVTIGALTQPSDPDRRSKFDGMLGGRFSAHGNESSLQLDTQIEARRARAVGDPASLDVVVSGKYAADQLTVRVRAGDRNGQLADLEFADELPLEHFIAQPGNASDLVLWTRWKANAEFSERRVRELPVISGLGVSHDYAPLTFKTSAHIAHEPGAEPEGDLKTTLRWAPTPGAVELGTCSDDLEGKVTLQGQLQHGQFDIRVDGGTKSDDAIKLTTGLQAKLADLLAGKQRNVGPLSFDMQVHELDLSALPIVCERGKGVVSVSVTAHDLFDKRANLKLDANAKSLSWDDSPPVLVQATVQSGTTDARLSAQIRGGHGQLQLEARAPLDVRVVDPGTMFNAKGPISAKARLDHIEAAALLAFAPGVKRVSGALNGSIETSGTLQAPNTHGTLALDDVSFTLPRLGQRFSHLNLKASLNGRKVRFDEGKVRDLDGRASFDAQLILPSGGAWDADLNLKLRNFPVRKSGVMMGRADADAKIQARSTEKNTDVTVRLSNVAIALTTSEIASVQSLDPHPEIVFSDSAAPPAYAIKKQEQEDAANDTSATHATIHILTADPLWVRRDDFAVQMTTDLTVALGDGPPKMTGSIQMVRGYISLLGQTFDIKSGRVTMTGGTDVDPALEITATESTPDGTVVQVDVSGFVTHPVLAFRVNNQPVASPGEAFAALNAHSGSGGSDSQAMENQVASAAIGMTTGLLSLGARREFGAWIPMLSFEQGEQTRLRVGFEADKLIPKFMRGFVRGAYVEGVVAGENNAARGAPSGMNPTSATANTSAGEGVLLELQLPKDLVWAGQYGPGTVWSVDLDWRPQ